MEGSTDNLEPKNSRRVRRSFIILTVVFFIILLGFLRLFQVTHDLAENSKTIAEQSNVIAEANRELIQANQRLIKTNNERTIFICRRSLEGIRQTFKPFFPPEPRNALMREVISKFNTRINLLKRQCSLK